MGLKEALAHIAMGPVRGARQVNQARNNLGELLFPKQFDPQGNEINAGIMPFFGLPRPPAGMNQGIAGGTFFPKGLLKLRMPKEFESDMRRATQKPILHLPEKQLTLTAGDDTGHYVHADLQEAFSDYLRQAGIKHDLPRARYGKSSLVDPWAMKEKPVEARWRDLDSFQSSAGVDIYEPEYGVFNPSRGGKPPDALLRDIHKEFPDAPRVRTTGMENTYAPGYSHEFSKLELRQASKRANRPTEVSKQAPKAVNWPAKETLNKDPMRAARIAHKTMAEGTTARTMPRDLRSALIKDKVYKASGRVTPVQKSTRATIQRGVEGAKAAVSIPSKTRYKRSGR